MSAEPLSPVTRVGRRRWSLHWRLQGNGRSRVLGLVLLLALLTLQIWDPAPLEILRQRTFDLYQVAKPRQPLQQPVVIVDIDEESLAEIGQWPWPRSVVARLVDRLREAGAVAIAFDIVFAEPDRAFPGYGAGGLAELLSEAREAPPGPPGNDALLAEALGRVRAVLGESAYHRRLSIAPRPEPAPSQLALIGNNPLPHLFQFPDVVRNIEPLELSAAGRAVFNLVPATDGVVRQVPAFVAVNERILPSLTVELLRIATGGNAVAIKTDAAGVRSFVVAGVEVPTDRNGRIWVYYSEPRPELYVSARDLLNGTVGSERLAGKLVLIGTSATGLHDTKASPLRDGVPGVEIHAQVLEMIVSGQILLRPHYALGAELLLLAVVGLLMTALVPLIGATFTLLLGCCIAFGLSLGSWLLFTSQGILIDVAYPLVGSAAVFALLVFANYLREESRRQQVRSAFRHYLSPTLVDQLASDPSRLVLGGETRDITVLFSDVRGFTAISERLQDRPQELTRLMNRLLTPLSAEILASGGTIDKYMGDAIMAFWNAPLDDADHALHACRAALAMQDALTRLNLLLTAESEAGTGNVPRLEVGIGINSGLCVVGNMGSEQRFDYSVLGDAVNLASRLEGQCPAYGAKIILGPATAAAVSGNVVCVELDIIRVKGKREPQQIFAALGPAEDPADAETGAALTAIDTALAAYRRQDWDAALRALAEAEGHRLALLDLTVFVRLYRKRIEELRAQPLPAGWDGVYTATTK